MPGFRSRSRRADRLPEAGRESAGSPAVAALARDRTLIMAILNVTPDSFYDGGVIKDKRDAIRRAVRMADDGADIIDVGGESTRPGAAEVSTDEELSRVIPVIDAIAKRVRIPISVDTRKSAVAEEAIRHGASMINDVSGLNHDAGMALVAARYGVPVILMHMRSTPRDMQTKTDYRDVVRDVMEELGSAVRRAVSSGISKDRIVIDPGIGFSKTAEQNLEILNRLREFRSMGLPVCVGLSRKSFIGALLGRGDPLERLAGTIASCAVAVTNGADILRVHDVREARDAAIVAEGIANMKVG
jgi:dihydropteroate synthase